MHDASAWPAHLILVAVLLVAGCAPASHQEAAPFEQPESHRRMIEALDAIAGRTADDNVFVGDRATRVLGQALADLPADTPATRRGLLEFQFGEALLKLGREDEAIAALERAAVLADSHPDAFDFEQRIRLAYRTGVAYMRSAETQNCCRRYTPDSCVLPIRGRGIHLDKVPAQKAVEQFTYVLRRTPPESGMHLTVRWLFNLAHMVLGDYPDKVPQGWLVPPAAFDSEESFPRFANIGQQIGVSQVSLAGGAIADDFTGDGRIDLLVSTWDPHGQLRLWVKRADGMFVERTGPAGLTGIRGGLNMIQADYDNDGDVDVYVLRGAWLERGGMQPDSLLRNNGNGTFSDVTFDAGLDEQGFPTQTATWTDYDNDGDLDLYVGAEQEGEVVAACRLFRNNGDGTFTDVAAQAGVTNDRFTKAVIAGDFDNDRDPDLYVSNLGQPNRLYRNNGDGTFADVAESAGVTGPSKSFPAWFWDYDNDGNLDLYVTAYSASVAHLAAHGLGFTLPGETARLYRGDGRGGFRDVTAEVALDRPNAPMGSNFGDIDGDGWLDFYLGTGYPDFASLMPNVMFRNRAGQGFADVTTAGGFGHLQKGHAVVFADLDDDGDQDLFEQMGGAYAGDAFLDALYENPGFGNHWLSLRLVGTTSNRSAIGARIRVDIVEDGVRRTIYKHVNSGGTFGANPLRQNLGLGRAERIERLEVFWPTSGLTQSFDDVSLDVALTVEEGDDRLRSERREPIRLGGAAS